jgi:transposase InsO family protein
VQERRRRAEREVRAAVAAFCRSSECDGASWNDRSALLGVSDRTLRYWDHDWRENQCRPILRGRPTIRSSVDERNKLLAALELLGPHVGVPTLKTLDISMGLRELEDFVRRYKRLLARWERQRLHTLTWWVPGTVWAMDHAMAPWPVDGVYPYLFAVRDLASGHQLGWLPVLDETAQTTNGILAELFERHGPPLVLKSDRGPAFIAKDTAALLAQWGVTHLLSPPWTPSYNGSAEAGIGSMKTRTRHEAAGRGLARIWTSDHCYAALQQANAVIRCPHLGGGTHQEVWAARPPISHAARHLFLRTLEDHRVEAVADYWARNHVDPDRRDREATERKAITRTLVAGGYLRIRRRPLSLPLSRFFAARIS